MCSCRERKGTALGTPCRPRSQRTGVRARREEPPRVKSHISSKPAGQDPRPPRLMLVLRERDSDRSIPPSLLRLPAGCRVGILTSLRHAILNRLHPSPSALIQCVGPGFVRFRVASVACAWLYARYSSMYACRAPMCIICGMWRARGCALVSLIYIYTYGICSHQMARCCCCCAVLFCNNLCCFLFVLVLCCFCLSCLLRAACLFAGVCPVLCGCAFSFSFSFISF